MKINFDYLLSFVSAYKYGSFSKAARALNKAQSVISTHVIALEDELDYKLFIRGKSLVLTEKGAILLPIAEDLLKSSQALQKTALALHQYQNPVINLGIDFSIYSDKLFDFLSIFAAKFEDIILKIYPISSFEVNRMLDKGKIDIALYFAHIPAGKYNLRPLGFVETKLVAAYDHPLAKMKNVTKNDLADFRHIVVSSPNSINRGFIFSSKYWQVDNYYYALSLVSNGLGYAIIPKILIDIESHFQGKLVFIDDGAVDFPDATLSVVWQDRVEVLPHGEFLINGLSTIFKNGANITNIKN